MIQDAAERTVDRILHISLGNWISITDRQQDERVSNKQFTDAIESLRQRVEAQEEHFKSTDAAVALIKNTMNVLDTNQQLLNAQLQYIGTSHISPSTKK